VGGEAKAMKKDTFSKAQVRFLEDSQFSLEDWIKDIREGYTIDGYREWRDKQYERITDLERVAYIQELLALSEEEQQERVRQEHLEEAALLNVSELDRIIYLYHKEFPQDEWCVAKARVQRAKENVNVRRNG
jgi:hypothetical protein